MSSNHSLRWLFIAITTALAQGQTYKCNEDNLLRNLQHNTAAAGIFCGGSPADFVPPLPTFLPSTSYPIQSLSSACYCLTNTLSSITSSTSISSTSSTSASSTSSATSSCQTPVTITSISTITATVTSTLPDVTLTSTITLTPAASTVTDDITLPASTITTTVSATATPSTYFSPYSGGGWIALNYPYILSPEPYFEWTLEYDPSDIDINSLLAECIERYHAAFNITSNLIESNSYTLALADDNIFWCIIPWNMLTIEDLTVDNTVQLSSTYNGLVLNAWTFNEYLDSVDDYTLPLAPLESP